MHFRKFTGVMLAALLLLPALVPTARADEGMWPFNNIPRADIQKRYGFTITDQWLDKARLASVRFNNGGSGSFVSPEGLVMTNHHVAFDTISKLSTPERDYVTNGFLAHTRAEELRAPDLELNVLVGMEDVTARVNSAVKPGMSDAEVNDARRSAIDAIEDESRKATRLRSDVVALYQGGQYFLYRYKQYTDVRLAFAPEYTIGAFGGDPDNFNFPRYCLDMALFRVYENGQPVRSDNYFKWSKTGAKEGDVVFVTGHPGTTERLNTVAHLEFLRDVGMPLNVKNFTRRRQVLLRYGAQGAEQKRRVEEELQSVENTIKVNRGQLAGLLDKSLMARKQRDERELRRLVAADAQKQRSYGDAWDQIARARKALASYERDRRFLGGWLLNAPAWAFNTPLFNYARTLVRLADESAKPNAERLPEFIDARRPSLELYLFSPAPVYDEFERIKLADSLSFMRDEYGANHPLVKKVLNGKTPEARAAELIDGTRLKDAAYRRQLVAGGQKAIAGSTDPFIVLARAIDPESRAVRTRYETEVTGVERTNYAKIAQAVFDLKGNKTYPDATFTLRLSYGAVKGYRENGKQVRPFTFFSGLYERAAQHKYEPPYALPQRWLDRKQALDLNVPFNFMTTNDTTGGNSGSPMINKDGEIIGLSFDGNMQSIVGSYHYDETVNRSIGVDARGMLESLRKVYGADALVQELTKQ